MIDPIRLLLAVLALLALEIGEATWYLTKGNS